MSLAAVHLTRSQFDNLYDHLVAHSKHRNMHLRQRCTRSGKSDLRYLHAIYAVPGATAVHGCISGPDDLLWEYEIHAVGASVTMNVLQERAPVREQHRIAKRFLVEIFSRVRQEQTARKFFAPRRTPGQYYLRRWTPGISAQDQLCQGAVAAGVIAPAFVGHLASWNLVLLLAS